MSRAKRMTKKDLVAKTPLEPFNEIGAAYNCLKALLWLVRFMEAPGHHEMLDHILAIAEKLQDLEGEMATVSEGKKGRVICAWCKKDMGEAEPDLDTHGCCLKCVKLALREVDERLSAFGQGQKAGPRKWKRGKPGVKRVWKVNERPVGLAFLYGPLGMVGAMFRCPGCGKSIKVDYSEEELFFFCECGAALHLRVAPGLEELEGERQETLPGASP